MTAPLDYLKEQFKTAERLYRAGRIDDAVWILRRLKHPRAEAAIRKITQKQRTRVITYCIMGAVVVIAMIAVGFAMAELSRRAAADAEFVSQMAGWR